MKQVLKIFAWLFLIFSLGPAGCAGTFGYFAWQQYQWVQTAEKVDGQVVDLVPSSSSSDATWKPLVAYQYQGVKKEYLSRLSSNPKPYAKGDKVVILINANNPEEVCINSFKELYLFKSIFGGIGLILFISFLFVSCILFFTIKYVDNPKKKP